MRQIGNTWVDNKGEPVNKRHVSKYKQNDDRAANALATKAKALSDKLLAFKKQAFAEAIKSHTIKVTEHGINGKPIAGNLTLFVFDGSVKIELRVSEGIYFDEVLIDEAKSRFKAFIKKNLKEEQSAIGDLILGAFDKTDGKLDPKRILHLHRFRNTIKDKEFHSALDLVDQSTQPTDSKQYMRFWVRNDEGEFEAINLNFSSIN